VLQNTDIKITPKTLGATSVTVSVNDGKGGIASTTFVVNVVNQAPTVKTAFTNAKHQTGVTQTIALSDFFTDLDNDALTYTLVNSNTSAADASIAASTLTYTTKASGICLITVIATDIHNASVTSSLVVVVETNTGIDDSYNNASVEVYPNPVSSFARIQFDLETTEKPLIRLFDANGRLIIEERAENANSHIIDTQSLSKGVYFIHIEVNSQTIAVKKLLKL